MKFVTFETSQLSLEVAKHILSSIIKKFLYQDKVVLALSGGNTPKSTYEWLGKYIKSEEILDENSELHIIQVDERLVPYKNNRRNHLMIENAFDCSKRSHIYFHYMPASEEINSISDAIFNYENKLGEIDINKIDIILLGMGLDGHTASLFPFNDVFIDHLNSSKRVIGMFIDTQNENRLSLSPNFIKSTNEIILLIKGKKKTEVFLKASKSDDIHEFPIKLVQTDNLLVFSDDIKIKELIK